MGQVMVAVQRGAAMARHMFDHRQDAAVQMPLRHRAAQPGHGFRVRAVTAVAQKGMGFVARQIQHRGAIAVDAYRAQLMRDQPGAQIHRTLGPSASACHVIERGEPVARQRRAQALHPAAFLIDGDHTIAAHRFAHLCAQRANLIGTVDIAGKQDEAKRIGLAKQGLFIGAEPQPLGIEDGGAEAHRVVTGMQSARSATRTEQK